MSLHVWHLQCRSRLIALLPACITTGCLAATARLRVLPRTHLQTHTSRTSATRCSSSLAASGAVRGHLTGSVSMTTTSWIAPLLLALLLGGCGRDGEDAHAHAGEAAEHGGEAHAEEAAKGSHGGRLLSQDGDSVELAIAEDGTPPTYQAWLYRDGKPLPATAGSVEVRLTRLGGATEVHRLSARPDGRLLADSVVAEPHSFDVELRATVQGKAHRWTYESYEGRTTITAAIAKESGIRVAPVAAGSIADQHEVQGLLTPAEGGQAQATARFPGPVRSLRANVGDQVRAGQVLATVESNLSLTTYSVSAPISGTVLARNASVGSNAGEGQALFEIADLSTLWVDLHIFGADAGHITAGAPVTVTRISDGVVAQTTLERVLPGTATASQSTVARAVLRNTDGLWRPGSAVKARVTVAQQPAKLVMPVSALQQFRDWQVVFVQVGETYEVRPLTLGARDAQHVEVLSGVAAGDVVVVEQSYLVKADIGKSGASHDH
ncbi:cation efflux system protein [Xanthomonas campestris pv. campestris str. 8004]|uniref:Cation efflux system protein n=3 Tax=Xanthomonas campestris TaxID=339 RepID=Q8P3N4_XANCP|nr:cation efflux system protein [Xanthomonas campestris pv. campestris str. ATCC 33913]AAY51165.1 cation efflux system protein [Xanthomonas campestris pv. campestris str. 8004]QCX66518.1 cation efflux system protein [Xanthomonas campestris pv. campestris]QCX72991.1 cation efflux system protein [Xanthomonas campestris pv. campestris]